MNASEYDGRCEDIETCYDCEHKCSEHKCVCKFERIPKPLKPNRTRLKCGVSSGSVTLPVATLPGVTFTLATVNVETKGMKHPCIQLEFASNIITTAASLILNFQIFKQCRNQLAPIPIGRTWTFLSLDEVTDGNNFSFSICDCDLTCDECCIYSVIATQADVSLGIATINNSSLTAVIVDAACEY
ncbi:DUF4489 domain-containing protein [Lacrimispora sp. BS-2]|uniref:DUF4489 domain-containing protein n=1 Tax=Lacrimispora sp. BS-2 TaxID=3151850 RepID=A0AAU7PSB3_9FIRM